jgi:hypothetical protein
MSNSGFALGSVYDKTDSATMAKVIVFSFVF